MSILIKDKLYKLMHDEKYIEKTIESNTFDSGDHEWWIKNRMYGLIEQINHDSENNGEI